LARIVWMSDSPLRASGFGLVTAEVCKRLANLGHDILVLGWWSADEVKLSNFDVKPCPVSPKGASAAIAKHLADFQPDVLITLGDVPWLSFIAGKEVQYVISAARVRWFIYYPVDGVLSDGRLPVEWVNVLSKADEAITMSKFGLIATERSGIRATVIPHGCDTELFRPPLDKEDAKRRLGYNGKFVILSDARNHRRKQIPRALDIVRNLDIPKSKLVFHLHTNSDAEEDVESYRYNLRADIDLLGLEFVKGLRDGTPPSTLSIMELAALYAAADVYLLASFGEGFGLPTLQAASSGVVPIVPANSASTELVGSHGFAISCDSSSGDEFGIPRYFINRQQATLAVQQLYFNPDLLRARSMAGRSFALGFSWDHAVRSFDALVRFHTGMKDPHPANHAKGSRTNGAILVSDEPKSLNEGTIRQTGHDVSILPIPLIGIPTRLEIRRQPQLAATPPLLLVEQSCINRLRPLERIFPGVIIHKVGISDRLSSKDLCALINGATLVVDPKRKIHAQLDYICAIRGVNFLGKSNLWPAAKGQSLTMQARCLLTDYAFSDARVSAAERLARNLIAMQRPQIDIQ
jgi:glycosyltransferase involved in cell wall biosynthesis